MTILFLLFIITKANAYIPVIYSCCINYSFGDGILLDGFENTTNWRTDINSIKEEDTINFKEGKQGIRLIATNGNRSYIDKKISNNFSYTNNFALWLYVYNVSSFNYINIYFTSTGSAWGKYFSSPIYGGLKTGWNELVLDKNSFKNTRGEDWNNIMNMIRIAIYPKTGYSTNVTVDDLRYDIKGKRAKIILSFDDGDVDNYNNAFPILNSNNQPGAVFIITSTIGNKEKMNLSDLRDLQSAGWDVSSHTVDHPHLTVQNDTMQYLELNNSYDWLTANKFQKSAGIIAYPYGEVDDKVIDKVKQRYILGRSTVEGSAQQHFIPADDSSRYIQRVINVFNNTTVQLIEDKINDSINSKLLGILVFHGIVDRDPTRYQNTKKDLRTISDYLKSRSIDVDVVTFSDYLIPNINNYTPVINKTVRIFSNGTAGLITKNKYDEYMPNMTVRPSSGFIDVDVAKYSDQLIKFSESNSTSRVLYSIGDLTPYAYYSVQIYWGNDTIYQDFNVLSNSTGYLNYNLIGNNNRRYQLIRPIIPSNGVIIVTIPIMVACIIVYYLRKKRNTNVRNQKI